MFFYNGTAEMPPEIKLRLSEAFINEDKIGDFEWTATVININPDNNDNLLDACPALKDYMTLVCRIRETETAAWI